MSSLQEGPPSASSVAHGHHLHSTLLIAGGSLIKLIYFRMNDREQAHHALAAAAAEGVDGPPDQPARGGAPAAVVYGGVGGVGRERS